MENLNSSILFDRHTKKLIEESELRVKVFGNYLPDISASEIQIKFEAVDIDQWYKYWVATLGFTVEDSAEYQNAIKAINIEVRKWLLQYLGYPVFVS